MIGEPLYVVKRRTAGLLPLIEPQPCLHVCEYYHRLVKQRDESARYPFRVYYDLSHGFEPEPYGTYKYDKAHT